MCDYKSLFFTSGRGGAKLHSYEKTIDLLVAKGPTVEAANATLQKQRGPRRDPDLVAVDGKRNGDRCGAKPHLVTVDCKSRAKQVNSGAPAYHESVQKRVRETHPSFALFELEACFHPNRDVIETSRTYIVPYTVTDALVKAAKKRLETDTSCTTVSEVS